MTNVSKVYFETKQKWTHWIWFSYKFFIPELCHPSPSVGNAKNLIPQVTLLCSHVNQKLAILVLLGIDSIYIPVILVSHTRFLHMWPTAEFTAKSRGNQLYCPHTLQTKPNDPIIILIKEKQHKLIVAPHCSQILIPSIPIPNQRIWSWELALLTVTPCPRN